MTAAHLSAPSAARGTTTPQATPTSDVETELKLDVPVRYAAKVLAHRAFRTRPAGPLSRSRLLGVYYDTPDFDLWQARMSVRLRRSASGWVQTLKWAGGAAGGLHRRNELEWSVPEQALAFEVIPARAELALLFDERIQRRLKPVFVTEFERVARMLTLPDGSKVEASLDRGRIVCGTSMLPLCELELELKSGEALALFDIAAAFMADLPVRPAYRSKAERGYLLAGLSFPPVKAGKSSVASETNVPEAVAGIIGAALAQVQANEHGMLHGDDIEYLHQMRVGVRRLRSCLSAFSPSLDNEALLPLQTELKWLGARLGAARDWDVFCAESLPTLRAGFANLDEGKALDALVQKAAELRERAARSARAGLRSKRASTLLVTLGRIAAGGEFASDPAMHGPSLAEFGPRLLDRRLSKVLRCGKKVRKAGGIEKLHRLRIAVKKLRYAVEFQEGIYEKTQAATDYRRLLIKLQDRLGRICDAFVMTQRVAQVVPDQHDLVACVNGWGACAIHAERKHLRKLWRAFKKAERFW